ncbi:hypothetical protein BFW87_27620 [Pseudomonas fluorescens]|uniref:Transmembrane protein n=1 Tax=Pseudomonas fluorescens TaxID=294 RepID=A0A1T2XZJ3_PSEFL|nr:hypothetical protein [Pseudomonas fluorescens]OPA85206.1 hypothetical protein BFW87_27620 [Pseudomonas fluorescens]
MRDKLLNPLPPVMFNALLWLCAVTILLMLKNVITPLFEVIDDDWLDLDLAVALCAYVLLFLLEPMRNRINRRLRKRSRRKENRHRS